MEHWAKMSEGKIKDEVILRKTIRRKLNTSKSLLRKGIFAVSK